MNPEGRAYLAAAEAWKTADRSDAVGFMDAEGRLLSSQAAFERTAEGRSFFTASAGSVSAVLASEPVTGPSEAALDAFQTSLGLGRVGARLSAPEPVEPSVDGSGFSGAQWAEFMRTVRL